MRSLAIRVPKLIWTKDLVDSNTVVLYLFFMAEQFSIQQVADAVNKWCTDNDIAPVNGQAGEEVTERNVRYYRTVGLLDAPASGSGHGFSEKHRLQLIAIRILQSHGLPLRKIRELLVGRSIKDLREILSRGLAEPRQFSPFQRQLSSDELWRATPLDAEFILISRNGIALTSEQRSNVLSALYAGSKPRASQARSRTNRNNKKEKNL